MQPTFNQNVENEEQSSDLAFVDVYNFKKNLVDRGDVVVLQ